VSSFGFGGANCHIVLDDAYNSLLLRGVESVYHQTAVVPLLRDENSILVNGTSGDCQTIPEGEPELLVWSSADDGGIKRTQDSWAAYLSEIKVPDSKRNEFLHNLAHTLAARRSHLTWRTFAVADHTEGLHNLTNTFQPAIRSKISPKLAYIFTGVRSFNARWLISLIPCSKELNGTLWVASLLNDTKFSVKVWPKREITSKNLDVHGIC
jgi:hypothetical protein